MAAAMEQDTNQAISKYEVVVSEYPQDANAHFLYGLFLRFSDQKRAIAEIKKAIELDPTHVPALVGLATIYRKNGEFATARDYAERAVKAGPNDFVTHIALGRALIDLDDFPRAALEFETAVRLQPNNPEAHFSLASAYMRLGRRAEAERENAAFRKLSALSKPDAAK